MKLHAKYNHGFLCLDDENIYLTKSGWSDVPKLEEKSIQTVKSKNRRQRKNALFLLFFGLLFVSISIATGKAFLLLSLAILLFLAYKYLAQNESASIKIPLEKVTHHSIEGKSLIIEFQDSTGDDTYELAGGFKVDKLEEIDSYLKEKVA